MADNNKNLKKTAVALTYDPDEDAPKVIASGTGRIAERIIEAAKDADVPVHQDDKLANTLSKLKVGDMIPPELYEVVAEILVFVDRMDKIKEKIAKAKENK
ncbi:MAG: EscU/YscU/HrcU family type III secretion system export apparatus switch protein [Lachnospiraceae bacterium]|nr:EscU/YscU/HrcU family type III secretion system export apparatus switch protein [Lachnospiraceae bacterium]